MASAGKLLLWVNSRLSSLLPAESVDHPKADEKLDKADVAAGTSAVRGTADYLAARPVRLLCAKWRPPTHILRITRKDVLSK